MNDTVRRVFEEENILLLEALPFSLCRLIKPHKLERLSFVPQSAIVFLMPYYVAIEGKRNLSRYAVARDYHAFVKGLGERVLPKLAAAYPEASFALFSDNSPIDERHAAALAGLGVMGDNGLLLTEEYGPFVFIGEVLCDLPIEIFGDRAAHEIGECLHCGACRSLCPKKTVCLSALTQKKGILEQGEEEEIVALGSVWGCDRCQDACPYALKAKETPIEFFKKDLVPCLTRELLDAMDEVEFSQRAYAWRGRKTVARNIDLFENETE